MAYFANASEGERFERQWCCTCAHYGDDAIHNDCPILILHAAWNYEQMENPTKRLALDTLIAPAGEDTIGGKYHFECSMYHADPEKAREAERQRTEQHPWMAARKGNGDE